MEVKLGQITIRNRVRKNFGNLLTLADSIKRHGIIEPLVVEPLPDEKFLLISGERRLRASVAAGLLTVPVVLRTNLTPTQRKEIELEENLYREDLNWTEEAQIKLEIDQIKRAHYGEAIKGSAIKAGEGWSRRKLADALGQSIGRVTEDLTLATFLNEHPEEREEYAKLPKTTALRKMKQWKNTEQFKTERAHVKITETDYSLTDALSGLAKLKSESVDLILTDPPYASAGLSDLKKGSKHGMMFETDNLTVLALHDLMLPALREFYRVLKPGRHCYIFFSAGHLEFYRTQLLVCGFKVPEYPLIWFKGKNQIGAFGTNYMRSYEMLWFCYKPAPSADLKPLTNHNLDVLKFDPLKARFHQFEKPQPLLSFLIRQSSNKLETILDPFAGVASTIRAARSLDRRGLGFEINDAHYAVGLNLLKGVE